MGYRICPICQSKSDAPLCPVDGVPTVADEASEDPAMADPLLGRVVDGRYRVDARLGRGGMGTVYRAQQMVVNRPVALKVLHGHNASDEREVARFRQEARAVATLRHPHTVTLIDYGETEDAVFFLVMELIDGRTLREVIVEESPVSVSRATHIIAQIAESLSEAHTSGIVHRDLKPSNVLLTDVVGQSDYVKVVDFGIAKVTGPAAAPMQLTGTGLAIGSPRFMSPEQVSAMPVSPQSDLYALGAIFYELVTGQPLFHHTEATAYLVAHLNEQPPWPELDGSPLRGAAVDVCMACLAKLPSERPADALALLERLQGAAAETLLERIAPVVASGDAPRETATPTTVIPASDGGGGGMEVASEPGPDLPTTRKERAASMAESIVLPGQHVAVSSSPTLCEQSPVASGEVERSELVTLLEAGPRSGVRHQLQTGFPGIADPGDADGLARAGRGPGVVSRRVAALVGFVALVSASVALLGAPTELSDDGASRAPGHQDRVEPFATAPEARQAGSLAAGATTLEPTSTPGFLVHSRPEGARVLVNGTLVGTTPFRLDTQDQIRTLSLEKDGYFEAEIDVEDLQRRSGVIARLRARH